MKVFLKRNIKIHHPFKIACKSVNDETFVYFVIGLSKEGGSITLNLTTELVLLLIGYLTFVPAVQVRYLTLSQYLILHSVLPNYLPIFQPRFPDVLERGVRVHAFSGVNASSWRLLFNAQLVQPQVSEKLNINFLGHLLGEGQL